MDSCRSLRVLGSLIAAFGALRLSKALLLLLLPVLALAGSADEPDSAWVEQTLRSLSLRDKVAQLVQIRVPGRFLNRQSAEFREIVREIRENHVGGVVLFAGNVYESAILLNELQTISRLPLIVAADFERGLSFRIEDTTSFPWTMAFGAAGSEQFAYEQGLITGQESRALGVHWVFAPVLDVNNNPGNPVINIRSFGEDPGLVSRLGTSFIRGAQKAGVLTTAKHFPGHGDTATDSHLGLAVIASDPGRLQSVELAPFRSAIEAGVDSVMTAHVAVPALTGDRGMPATLSRRILTDTLRNSLGFRGLVVTDALEMGGITTKYSGAQAAIQAIQAGADVLLLPTNTTVAINEVERAVNRGDIPLSRIDDSVRRILEAKSRLGLHRNRMVELDRIPETIAAPQSALLAQKVADRSITLVKDARRLLPLNPLKDTKIFSLVLASGLESSPGAVFQAEMRRRFLSVSTAWANERIPEGLAAGIEKSAAAADVIVCSTLARLSSGQASIAMPANQRSIIRKLIALGKPVIWVAFGNPYVLPIAPAAETYLCTFSYSDVSQIAAAKAISGAIAIEGRMPVSIPGHARPGDGLQIPKLPMTLEYAPLSRENFRETSRQLAGAVKSGAFYGAQVVAGLRGRVILDLAGPVSSGDTPAGTARETAMELASLSQLVGTGTAAMLAIENGALLPGARVQAYLPELDGSAAGNLRISDLLKPAAQTSRNVRLVDEAVARATGVPTHEFLAKNLFEPLGMKVTVEPQPQLSCSAGDLAILAQMLLNKGIYDHRRYFKPATVARYTGAQGWWSTPAGTEWTRNLFSRSAFGHISASGPVLWIDPGKELFVILLARANPKAPARIEQAQRQILESLLAEINNLK